MIFAAPDGRVAARVFLRWLVAAPLIGVAARIFDGIFIGVTRTGLMLRTMILSVAVYAVALAVLVPMLSNHRLWAALAVLNLTRSLTMVRVWPRVVAGVVAKASGPDQPERR